MSTLAALALFTEPSSSYFVSISDKSYPFINEVNSGLTLAWSYGNYAQLTRSSVALRVNERGVNFIHTGNIRDVTNSRHWEMRDCYDSTTSLCALSSGSRFFPFDKVRIASNRTLVSPEIKAVAMEGCKNTRDSRRWISDQVSVYDVSLCDVVDSRLDVLYLNMDNKVLMRRNSTALWVYVLVSLVSVYLVSNIAQNVSMLLAWQETGKLQESFHRSYWFWALEVGSIGTALLAVTWPCLFEMVLVTDLEFLYCVYCLVYLLLHSVYYFYRLKHEQDNSSMLSFNLITGTLLLLTQGVYHTVANPYAGILLIMLCLRTFYKLYHLPHSEQGLSLRAYSFHAYSFHAYIVLDLLLLVATYYIGLRQTFLYRFSADVSFVMILLFSWVVSSFISK